MRCKYGMVRNRSAGVLHKCGARRTTATLTNARRIWYWTAPPACQQLANDGLASRKTANSIASRRGHCSGGNHPDHQYRAEYNCGKGRNGME